MKINLIDQRKPQKESFKYDDGIKAYIDFLNKDKEGLHETLLITSEYPIALKKKKMIKRKIIIIKYNINNLFASFNFIRKSIKIKV